MYQKLFIYSKISVVLFFMYGISSCTNEAKKTLNTKPPEGMVWVETKTFLKGAKSSDLFAMPREKPAHLVTVDGFFIDATEVTNKQFEKFVESHQLYHCC